MSTKRRKILVVDDEPWVRLALAQALRGWSYEVSEAGTIADAVVRFDDERFDAVLLDIDLPDGSGLDALRAF